MQPILEVENLDIKVPDRTLFPEPELCNSAQ